MLNVILITQDVSNGFDGKRKKQTYQLSETKYFPGALVVGEPITVIQPFRLFSLQ